MEIIAEIGQNHDGDMGRAREMIHAAAEAGADAAKFQVYDAAALFPKDGNPWYDYNLKTELAHDDVLMLAEECGRAGIEFLASVFDVQRVAWLEEAGVKRYKIASRSACDQKLIAALAATGKPLIVSLGMWEGKDFPAITAQDQVDFLYCVSKYPTPLEDLRLSLVDFTRYAGFSDHTVGTSAAMAAFARGARILEKHLTLDKTLYGPDHACSMDMDELRAIRIFRDDLARCL
ncbi:N-acetylneuraminate synthase family protein [Desulfocurvus sp. DL9XJH121]